MIIKLNTLYIIRRDFSMFFKGKLNNMLQKKISTYPLFWLCSFVGSTVCLGRRGAYANANDITLGMEGY